MTISIETQNVSEETPAVSIDEEMIEQALIPRTFFPPVKPLRRLAAFLIDMLLLTGFLGALLLMFGQLLYGVGAFNTLSVGFLIVLAYFGYFQSYLCRGKTPGMKAMGLSVRGMDGKYLSLPRSLLRGAVLAVIITFLKVMFSGVDQVGMILNLLPVIAGGAIIVLFLFNWKTGQSAHDVLAKSRVVFEKGERIVEYPATSREIMIWAIIPGLAVGLIPLVYFNIPPSSRYIKEITPYYQALKQDPRFFDARVAVSILYKPGEPPLQDLEITIAPKADFASYPETEKVKLINSVLGLAKVYLPVANYPAWEMQVIRKTDFGIISMSRVWEYFSYSNEQVSLEMFTVLFFSFYLRYHS